MGEAREGGSPPPPRVAEAPRRATSMRSLSSSGTSTTPRPRARAEIETTREREREEGDRSSRAARPSGSSRPRLPLTPLTLFLCLVFRSCAHAHLRCALRSALWASGRLAPAWLAAALLLDQSGDSGVLLLPAGGAPAPAGRPAAAAAAARSAPPRPPPLPVPLYPLPVQSSSNPMLLRSHDDGVDGRGARGVAWPLSLSRLAALALAPLFRSVLPTVRHRPPRPRPSPSSCSIQAASAAAAAATVDVVEAAAAHR